MQSEQINELAAALSKAQAKMKGAVKDAENPYFDSTYADLSSVWEACRGPLTENGLSVVQTTKATAPGEICLVTTLLHTSGQWIRGELQMKPVKPDPQAAGSCITYARRYALAAIVGVSPEDDDGNGASSPTRRDGKPVNTALPTQVRPTPQAPVQTPPGASSPITPQPSILTWAATKGWISEDVSRLVAAAFNKRALSGLTTEEKARLRHVIENFEPGRAIELALKKELS